MGVFGDKAAFVRLDVADDVPDDVRAVGELVGFVVPFLDVVFAEVALPVLIQRADVIGGKGFADGDELHAVGGAVGLGFGLGDLGLDGLEVGDKVGHGGVCCGVVGDGVGQPENGLRVGCRGSGAIYIGYCGGFCARKQALLRCLSSQGVQPCCGMRLA